MEAPRQGLFSSRHFAASKSNRSKLAAIDHDIGKPIVTPSDIAARCVMVGSIKSQFVHETLRLMFPSLQNAKSSHSRLFRRVWIYRNQTVRIDVVVCGCRVNPPLKRASPIRQTVGIAVPLGSGGPFLIYVLWQLKSARGERRDQAGSERYGARMLCPRQCEIVAPVPAPHARTADISRLASRRRSYACAAVTNHTNCNAVKQRAKTSNATMISNPAMVLP